MNRNLLTGVFLLLCLLLIVSESQACDDTAPLAKLSNPFHQHVCVGEGVNFDAIGGAVHGSHDPDNGSPYGEGHGISIYGWYYGDGGGWNYTDGGTPTHTYDSPGLYTVYLYVYDDDEGTRSEDYDYCMVYVDEVDSVVKIDPGPEEEGHVYILLGDYVLLEAKKSNLGNYRY